LIVILSTAAGLTLSAHWGLVSFLMVAVGTGLGLAYSLSLKRSAWSWLPFAVAFPLLPAWIVSIVSPHIDSLWTIFLIGAPVAVAIHLADSLPDIESDRLASSGGIAVRLGTARSFVACRLLLGLGALVGLALSLMTGLPILAVLGSLAGLLGVLASTSLEPPKGRHLVAVAGIALGAGWVGALCL
jgi:4-hydroxybenzoate polyprenyltransferase